MISKTIGFRDTLFSDTPTLLKNMFDPHRWTNPSSSLLHLSALSSACRINASAATVLGGVGSPKMIEMDGFCSWKIPWKSHRKSMKIHEKIMENPWKSHKIIDDLRVPSFFWKLPYSHPAVDRIWQCMEMSWKVQKFLAKKKHPNNHPTARDWKGLYTMMRPQITLEKGFNHHQSCSNSRYASTTILCQFSPKHIWGHLVILLIKIPQNPLKSH